MNDLYANPDLVESWVEIDWQIWKERNKKVLDKLGIAIDQE